MTKSLPRLGESGNLLTAVGIALLPVIGLITAFYSRSLEEVHAHEARKSMARAVLLSMAGMDVARNVIMHSSYDDPAYADRNAEIWGALDRNDVEHLRPSPDGTTFMFFNRETGGREYRAYGEVQAPAGNYTPYRLFRQLELGGNPDSPVRVYVVQLTGLWHMLESVATVRGVTRTSRVIVRERDPFTRYSVLIGSHYQGIAGEPKGDVHTNKKLQIFFPDGHFDDFVSAHEGFEWMVGADWSNTTFDEGWDDQTESPVSLPDLQEVQERIRPPVADLAAYERADDYVYVGSNFQNVQIDFDGDQVTVSAQNAVAPGPQITLYQGSLDGIERIYAVGAITHLEGDLDGRLSVSTESPEGVNVTDSVRYVDGNGECAMTGTGSADYAPNPDYVGNSALGIIAPEGPVVYDHNVSENFEMHAAVYAGKNVGVPGLGFTGPEAPWPYSYPGFGPGQYVYAYDPTFQKQNLMMLGLTIAEYRWVGSVVNSSGTVLSGFQDSSINYDRALLNNPPPFFLDMARPLFKAVEILENSVDM